MNKTAKTIICVLTAVCLILAGLLVWSRIDAAKTRVTVPDTSEYKLYKNIISDLQNNPNLEL